MMFAYLFFGFNSGIVASDQSCSCPEFSFCLEVNGMENFIKAIIKLYTNARKNEFGYNQCSVFSNE